MSKKFKKISILGGDLRQVYMANLLGREGAQVTVYGLEHEELEKGCKNAENISEAISSADVIILPIPLSKDGIHLTAPQRKEDLTLVRVLSSLQKGQVLYGGCFLKEWEEECHKQQIETVDFMKSEEITIFNSIATAEGAILEAIRHYPFNLHGSSCLVTGFGRCAKILADKLKGLSANVCVCARSSKSRAEAEAYGYRSCTFENWNNHLDGFDLLFNTVPYKVLREEELTLLKEDAVIIDIATSPGGVDYGAAKRLDKNAHLCLGLPGKYAPKASAEKLVSWMKKELD